MKKNIGFFALFTISMMGSSFAQTNQYCPQQANKFLEIARTYNSCNSPVGADQTACQSFCEEANKLMGPMGGAGGSCSSDQIRSIQSQAIQQGVSQGRQQGRDEVLRDLSIKEDYVSVDYFGINEADCGRRASSASQALRLEAIGRCNNKAVSIKNCYISTEKVTGSDGRPPRFTGEGNFKEKDEESTQVDCERVSLAQATQTALEKCRASTGSQCQITPSETVITHKLDKPSIRIFGARDIRICTAKVVAEAPRDLSYKCNMRISARNQAFAN